MKLNKVDSVLSDVQLESELKRTVLRQQRFGLHYKRFITLVALAAMLALIVTLWLPVYRIDQNSMDPFLREGQIVIGCRIYELMRGDVVTAYFDGQKQFVRIIGISGDIADVDQHGYLSINGKKIADVIAGEFPDILSPASYPYRIPEACYLVQMDCNRTNESAKSSFAYIDEDEITDKILFRIWPVQEIAFIG